MPKNNTSRRPIKINLKPDAYDAWERSRGGYARTVFGVAAAAVLRSMDPREFHRIMTMAGHYDDGRIEWQEIQEWIEKRSAEEAARAEAAVAEAVALTKGRVAPKKNRRTVGGSA